MGKVIGMRFVRSLLLYGGVLGGLMLSSCSEQDESETTKKTSNSPYEVSLDVAIDNPAVAPYNKLMTRVGVEENDASGLKTTWEKNDKLTVAYRSGGTLKKTDLTIASINGNSATFHGNVESSEDAQAFKTSTLYAVNNKETDKIDASIDNNKLKVSVDLSGQDGQAGQIANYDLLYAEGKASAGLRFNHKMCVVRMDFDCDPSASSGSNSLSETSFIYIPKTSTSKSMFADKATFAFGKEGETDGYNGVTFFSPKLSRIPLTNGKASVYVVVPANGKLTGELSIKVKCDNGSTFRRHLNIKEKSFPAQKVVAKTVKLKASERTPNIGDYLYSDGTWGPLVYYANKYPVALVFSNYTSPTDRKKGYTHGYAVGLRDAAWPTPWGPDNRDYPEAPNLFDHIDATAPLTMMNNLDGLSLCQTLNERYLKNYTYENYFNHGGSKAAIPLAMEYGGAGWEYAYDPIPLVPTPPHTSGWYLPSIGQWFLMFANLSGLDPNELQIARDAGGNVYSLSWLFSSAKEKNKYLKNFTKCFDTYFNPILGQYRDDGRIPESAFYLPTDDGRTNWWYLWACDEAKSDGSACCVRLAQTEIDFTYLGKRNGTDENNGYAARSVIAF